MKEGKSGRVVAERLEPTDDFIRGVTDLVNKTGVRSGIVLAIGTLEKALLLHYDGTVHDIEPPGPFEIASCMGNISVRDGKPMVHCHVVVSDAQGRAFAGHLKEGSPVGRGGAFVIITEVEGAEFQMRVDPQTRKPSWP